MHGVDQASCWEVGLRIGAIGTLEYDGFLTGTEDLNEIVVRQALFLFDDIGNEVEEPDKTAVYRHVEPFWIEADSINLVQGKEIAVESFHGDGRLSMHEDETHDDVPERSGLSFRKE